MGVDFGRLRDRVQVMIDGFIALLPNLVVAALVVLAFVLGARIARKFAVRTARHYNRTEHLGQIVGRLLQWIIFATGLLVALSVVAPSFQLKDLVSTLGIGGLAVGFAFRDVFQNFLAGLILLVTQPFHIGDQIKVKDFEGTVDEIETRATIIHTYDGRRVVIPNSTLFTEALSVNTTFDHLRSEYEVHLKPGADVEWMRQELLDAIQTVPDVLHDPLPEVLVSGLADQATVLSVRWWTSSRHEQSIATRDKVLTAIQQRMAFAAEPEPALATQFK
jgi:small conductance mechanosensitive channel